MSGRTFLPPIDAMGARVSLPASAPAGARAAAPASPYAGARAAAPASAYAAAYADDAQCEAAAYCRSLRGLTKQEWAHRCWKHLHLRSIRWHRRANPQQVLAEHRALQSIFYNLPCEECARHATQHYWQVLPDLTSNDSYHMWMFSFHNAVSERIGKAQIGYGEYQALYSNELVRAGIM